MAAALTASFILKLEDRLSSGIAALSKRLEALAALSSKLKFDGLQQAGGVMDKVGSAADRVSRKVEGIGRSARSAMAELQRLSSQPIMVNTGGTAFLPPSMGRAAMAATIAAAVAASGGNGGRVPALPSASFFDGPQLQISGPGGGGIELQPGRLFAARSAWSQLRGELGRTAQEAQRVGQELGHAGHAALTAAATGFGIYHMVHTAAEVDTTLRQAAIAQGLSGPAVGRDVVRMMKLVSEDATRTGQSVPGLAEAYGDLVARGLPPSLVDELIKTHSTAATAYHINPVELGQTVYSMNKILGIGHEEMGSAIGALAQSTHAGSFKMGDYARYLPMIAGQMGQMGWTGRGSLDSVAAMIEMTSHLSGTPQEAATDFKAMLDALTARYTRKAFNHQGIDLPAEMAKATKAGKNPVDAYLDILQDQLKGITDPLQQAFKLGDFLHNREAGAPVRALLQQREDQRKLTEQLHAVGGDKLMRDFASAMDGLQPKLNRLSAEWQVFEMRLGVAFAPLIGPVIDALHLLNAALALMDEYLPGVAGAVLAVGGGLAVMATVLGVLIPLFRAMSAGWGLATASIAKFATAVFGVEIAGGPILLLIGLIAVAALLIYEHWDKIGPFFQRLWAWVQGLFTRFVAWVDSWTGGAMSGAIDRLKAAWAGLKEWFAGLWKDVVSTFDGLIAGIERRIAEIKNFLGLGGGASGRRDKDPSDTQTPGVNPNPGDQRFQDGGGRPLPFAPISFQPGGQFGFMPLEVKVTVDGPARVEAPRQLPPVNRGPTLDRA